jgi:hypothetical protein
VSLIDILRRIFRKKQASHIASIDATASYSELTRSESESASHIDVASLPKESKLELEKESLQIGLAAGYTGRALHDILSSLNRIESLMVTKDWYTATDKSPQLYELLNIIKSLLEIHDKRSTEKLEYIENSLHKLSLIAEKSPEPIKSELTREIAFIRSKLPLSPTMERALSIIKETGEISYKDLTTRLGYTDVSSVRSLLSRMLERTDTIEKFNKDGEKWVRFKAMQQP